MGMPEKQSIKALKETDQNVERAIEWIFSHPDDDGTIEQAPAGQAPAGSKKTRNLADGPNKYRLTGFVSHIGSSVHVGHYVCHLLKDGKWTIFNDEKVALSEKPPKTLGYLYLYQRIRE
jgi:ubiquitin carboxyl-terminal hydrolase 5/13